MQERWLQGLLAFHITLLLVVILFRRIPGVHGAVFVGISEPGWSVGLLASRLSAWHPLAFEIGDA